MIIYLKNHSRMSYYELEFLEFIWIGVPEHPELKGFPQQNGDSHWIKNLGFLFFAEDSLYMLHDSLDALQ